MYLLMWKDEVLDIFSTKEEALFWYMICKKRGIQVYIKKVSWKIVG